MMSHYRRNVAKRNLPGYIKLLMGTFMKTLRIKLNMPVASYAKGEEIEIPCDENSVPLDKFWRRRLADSKIDHCLEIVRTSKKRSQKSFKKTSIGAE